MQNNRHSESLILNVSTTNSSHLRTVAKPARHLVMQYKFFCVCRPHKDSISEEMNNDSDLNLHLHDQMPGWLHYCLRNILLDVFIKILHVCTNFWPNFRKAIYSVFYNISQPNFATFLILRCSS